MTVSVATAATPSRLSQLERHWLKAFQRVRGGPRWKVEARSPPTARPEGDGEEDEGRSSRSHGAGRGPARPGGRNLGPTAVVKMMTEGAGCISEFLQRFVEPPDEALGLFVDRFEEGGQNVDLVHSSLGRGGRYLLTGLVPCSGIRSMPPRSATSLLTSLSGSPRSPKWRAPAGRCARRRAAVFFGQVFVVDAVDTERAFLHHAFGRIQFARAVGAGPGAKPQPMQSLSLTRTMPSSTRL